MQAQYIEPLYRRDGTVPKVDEQIPVIKKLLKMHEPLNQLIEAYKGLHKTYLQTQTPELKEKLEKIQSMIVCADKTINSLIESLKEQNNQSISPEQEQIFTELQKTMIKAYSVLHNHPINLNHVPNDGENNGPSMLTGFATHLGVAVSTAMLCYVGYLTYKAFKKKRTRQELHASLSTHSTVEKSSPLQVYDEDGLVQPESPLTTLRPIPRSPSRAQSFWNLVRAKSSSQLEIPQ